MESRKIRRNINKLLSQKKKLLTCITALSLTAASLTGCSEEQLFGDVTLEQNNDNQEPEAAKKNEKIFSYDEIANSYYISIYNADKEKFEYHFCKENKYTLEDPNPHYNSTEERSCLIDIDTKEMIVFGFDPTDSSCHDIESFSDTQFELTCINDKIIHKNTIHACHDNIDGKCQHPERELDMIRFLYHHLGSSYEFDHENDDHRTYLYIYGKVKEFLSSEDKQSNYTEEEYKQLKTTIVENYHIEDIPNPRKVKTSK